MAKKYIILVILLFSLTGCSAQYNLTIDEKTINEEIILALPKENFEETEIKRYEKSQIPVSLIPNEKRMYKTTYKTDNLNYLLKYNYSHDYDSIKESYFAHRCYENVNFEETDETIKISTSNEFLCSTLEDSDYKLDSLQINIKSKLKVLSNNADKVSGDTYTWYIDKRTYKNKPIEIEVQKKVKFNFTMQLAIGASVILLIGSLIYLFVRYKNKKNNEF